MRPHGLVEPDEDRLADQEVADIELGDLRDRGDRSTELSQAMPGVDLESEPGPCSARQRAGARVHRRAALVARLQGFAEGAGVQFHDRGAQVAGRLA